MADAHMAAATQTLVNINNRVALALGSPMVDWGLQPAGPYTRASYEEGVSRVACSGRV